MFGPECFNCGMLPFACVCIEDEHNDQREKVQVNKFETTDEELIDFCTRSVWSTALRTLLLSGPDFS